MKLKSIKKKIWSIVIIITTLIGILPVQANTTLIPQHYYKIFFLST